MCKKKDKCWNLNIYSLHLVEVSLSIWKVESVESGKQGCCFYSKLLPTAMVQQSVCHITKEIPCFTEFLLDSKANVQAQLASTIYHRSSLVQGWSNSIASEVTVRI